MPLEKNVYNLNQNKMKKILTFLSVFFFAQICEIYIMGGFDQQTIISKSASVLLGSLLGVVLIAVIESK